MSVSVRIPTILRTYTDGASEVTASGETLAEVIDESRVNEIIAKLRVIDLLQAMPGVGKVRAKEIMSRIGIADSRRLRGLGVNQISALLREFKDRG